jgi:CPA1 family monovalent cation:H+ antiporter
VAILVAIIARRLNLPYTVGLVVTGIGLAFVHFEADAALTHEFIFDVILPPLLFEAALNIDWRELRRDLAPVLTLSIFGVMISAAVVAAGLAYFLGWPAVSAAVFGILIGATDPVAVIAMFKDTGVKGRLRLIVESESLFNDGVAAVLFALALTWAEVGAEGVTMLSVLRTLSTMAGGGIAIGLSCGAAAIFVAGRTADSLVETALTAVAAYGSFLLAEHLHFSGVLATVAAGMVMGNRGVLGQADEAVFSTHGRGFVVAFWDFAAFIANSLIFLLIGVAVAGIRFERLGIAALLTIIGLVLLGRAFSVYPLCLIFRRGARAIPLGEQHILWWGGLRGALALALALALPLSLPLRNQILIAAFGVVTFSVLVQGMTMRPLLRKLRLLPGAL